jgi:hypothetical protein
VTESRADALSGLEVLVGEWTVEAQFPGRQPGSPGGVGEGLIGRSWFEWTLSRQFLVQRTEIPVSGVPASMMIVSADLETGAYTQHYYDSRGVARLYAMTLADGMWTLTRETPDFTPLEFRQRFTATFSEDANTISGAWEKRLDGETWEHDFTLTYRRAD